METKMKVYSKDFISACILRVSAGSTGPCGGDGGYGGCTLLRFQDQGGTSMGIRSSGDGSMIELYFCGDCERDLLIQALKWAISTYENPPKPGTDLVVTEEDTLQEIESQRLNRQSINN
jgi:hypothetical protein